MAPKEPTAARLALIACGTVATGASKSITVSLRATEKTTHQFWAICYPNAMVPKKARKEFHR